ncbi:MAG: hypothetical protein Q4E45_09855 [Eubacteriales bacterium]|nr:hypothetical protein [Eubacteriales bacterium]
MDSQHLVIAAAIFVALFMAFKPEMCIPNPKHRTPRFIAVIKSVGTAVAAVLIVWFLLTLFRR